MVDLMRMLLDLLTRANSGDKELVAVQGYTFLKELGRGGRGIVSLVRHEATGELVALKIMLPHLAVRPHDRELFLREIENCKALKHPNVVGLRDSGFAQSTLFFTMEYCDGGSVSDLVQRRGGKLPIPEAGPIILQALEGLAYAHSAEVPRVQLADGTVGSGRGLVHRDLKPDNLFLSGSGASLVTKIGDYGFAKAYELAGLSGLTASGTAAGTPEFMPRRQLSKFKYAKPEVDVWAMAASLYYMLTGAFPRDFSRYSDRFSVVEHCDPIPIRQREASIPAKLAEVIDLALSEKPTIHFQTASEFKQALEIALGKTNSPAP
jgi:serine/threonine protein kinase